MRVDKIVRMRMVEDKTKKIEKMFFKKKLFEIFLLIFISLKEARGKTFVLMRK